MDLVISFTFRAFSYLKQIEIWYTPRAHESIITFFLSV